MNHIRHLRKHSTKENIPLQTCNQEVVNDHDDDITHSKHLSMLSHKHPDTASNTPPFCPSTEQHPWQSLHYLQSPLETLTDSLNDSNKGYITQHDLAEAYSVLATRIKVALLKALESEESVPALRLLKDHSQTIVKALRRDIKRLLVNPCSHDGGMNPDEIQHAFDLTLLSHQAIRVVSEILVFPALYSNIPADQLRLLLRDILAILSESSLPTPHSKRTYLLLLWILQTQKLPVEVLASFKLEIAGVVARALDGGYSRGQAVIDGLTILTELLRKDSMQFLTNSCELLQNVLSLLTADSLDVRLSAAHALSAFAFAKIQEELSTHHSVSSKLSLPIRAFLKQHLSRKEKSVQTTTPSLLSIIQSAIQVSQLSHHGAGPQWAAVIIGSFIVLIDTPVFNTRYVKLLMNFFLIEYVTHPTRSVRGLFPPVWKCMVWAFGRLPPSEHREKALEVLQQELGGGIGFTLASVILDQTPDDENDGESVKKVLGIVSKMLAEVTTWKEGVELLCRLLHAYKGSETSSPILHREFFDGRVLESNLATLSNVIEPANPAGIRELRGQEIVLHRDELIECLKTAIKKILCDGPNSDIPAGIFSAWQSFLLADSELSQNKGHLIASPEFADTIGRICSEFAVMPLPSDAEVKQIIVLRKLWNTVQGVYTALCIEKPADLLLGAIVKRNFHVVNPEVQVGWLDLCRDVVVHMTTDVDGRIVQISSTFNMQVWTAVARKWIAVEKVTVSNLITFLKIPFPEQLQTDEELDLWDELFRIALLASESQGNATEARQGLWTAFLEEDVELPPAFPKQFLALFSAVCVPFQNETPHQALPLLNEVLYSLYPPTADQLRNAFRYLAMIRDMVLSTPQHLLIQCLAILSPSLCCWFSDAIRSERDYNISESVIPEQAYRDNVFPLYSLILNELVKIPPDGKTLMMLWRLFVSPLSGNHASKEVFDTFEAFWRATYHEQEELIDLYDPVLKEYLKAYDTAEQAGLAAALTQSDGSQLTGSFVPETQSQDMEFQPMANPSQSLREPKSFDEDLQLVPESSPFRTPMTLSNENHQNTTQSPISRSSRRRDRTPIAQEGSPTSTCGDKRKRAAEEDAVSVEDPQPFSHTSRVSQSRGGPSSSVSAHRAKSKGKGKLVLDYVEVPSRTQSRKPVRKTSSKVLRESQLMTPEPSAPPSSHFGASPQNEEDYASWEAPVSPGSLQRATRNLAPEISVDVEMDDPVANDVVPNSQAGPAKKKRRKGTSVSAPPRRRGRTKSRSPMLDQLQGVLQTLEDDSQTPVDDLVKATKLVHELGSTLSERLARRLAPGEPMHEA